MLPPPPTSTLFPYTTLFRSPGGGVGLRARAPPRSGAAGGETSLEYPPRYLRATGRFESARSRFLPLVESDRKSTRLNSSHTVISYAVFCLKKKKHNQR